MTQLRAASKDLKRLEIQFGMDSQTHTHTHLHSHAHSARGGSRVEYKPQTGGMNNTGWESDRHSVTPTWYPLMCGICNHMPEWEAVRHSDAFNSSSCGRTSRRRRSRTWLPWCHDASGRMPAIQLDESQGGPLASGLSISLNAKHHIHIYNSKYVYSILLKRTKLIQNWNNWHLIKSSSYLNNDILCNVHLYNFS